jgi:DNA-binding CsgD family transcriptional regulator
MTHVIERPGKSQTSVIGSGTHEVRHSRPRERLKGAESVGNPCLSEHDLEIFLSKGLTGIGDCPQDIRGTDIAREIGATGHAVFALTRGARGRHLACILRRDFPEVSPSAAGRLADGAMNAIKPFWWAHGATGANDFQQLRWANRVKGPLPGPAGLAFPVAAGPSDVGLVAFAGNRLSVSDRTLPELHRRCFGLFGTVADQSGGTPRGTASLARRELECIRLAADGLTSEEIAGAIGLSLHTANQYLAEAARKLNANGRMHAVAKALRLSLID